MATQASKVCGQATKTSKRKGPRQYMFMYIHRKSLETKQNNISTVQKLQSRIVTVQKVQSQIVTNSHSGEVGIIVKSNVYLLASLLRTGESNKLRKSVSWSDLSLLSLPGANLKVLGHLLSAMSMPFTAGKTLQSIPSAPTTSFLHL
jgi:hypothetical protein